MCRNGLPSSALTVTMVWWYLQCLRSIVSALVTQWTKPGKSCPGKPQLWTHLLNNLLCTGAPLAADLRGAPLWPFPGAETPWHYSFWHTLRGCHCMQYPSPTAWNKGKMTGVNGKNLMFQIWSLTGLSVPVCQCQEWFDCINQLWFFPGCQGWNNLYHWLGCGCFKALLMYSGRGNHPLFMAG